MGQQTDKEYLILSRIDEDEQMSQRELARTTGLSLGTVNLLLKKMVREGLIKMDSIPANRVVYMLTPQGMVEKAKKTVRYVRRHYEAIHEMRERIRQTLEKLLTQWESIYLLVSDDEMGQLVRLAVQEMDDAGNGLTVIGDVCEITVAGRPVAHCLDEDALARCDDSVLASRPVMSLLERI